MWAADEKAAFFIYIIEFYVEKFTYKGEAYESRWKKQ